MTTRPAGAALAALALLPATAQAAALAPLKPCYVSVTNGGGQKPTREPLGLGGNGFTPNSLIDISFDGKLDRTVQADPAGNLPPQVLSSPYRQRGEGAFTVTAAEHGNPANAASAASRNTALALHLRPARSKPSQRIHFSGRGFTAQTAVWAHYLHEGKLRKTVRLVRRINNPCGRFSVRHRQIPVKHPGLGMWRLQVDQQKRYSRAPNGVNVRADIRVQKVFRASKR